LQEALSQIKIDAHIYVPLAIGYKPREDCEYGEEENVMRSECYHRIDRYMFYVKHFKIIQDIDDKYNFSEYDVVHAHSLFSNGYIAMKLKEKYNLPYIVTVRAADVNTFFKWMIHLRNLGNRILSNAEAVVFLSKTYRELVLEKYVREEQKEAIRAKSFIVPNGIDDYWLKNKGQVRSLPDHTHIKILQVGALSRRKNIPLTINALDLLKSKGYQVDFTVVGKSKGNQIDRLIRSKEYINHIPPQRSEELLRIYREHDIFVMPSITETFGLVYPEAMSQGLPVIYTRGQGFDGQFDEGLVGYHVDCFDAKDIAGRIEDVIAQYEELSKACIQYAPVFNWNKIALTYKAMYEKINQKKEPIRPHE
jgi:glycosyltransferase involved in cell wall biosynthesis